MSRLGQLLKDILSDLPDNKLTLFNFLYSFFLNAPFRLALNYRIGHYLVTSGRRPCLFFADYLKYKQITKRNCQISYNANIGKHIFSPHPLSIVIGEKVTIKDNVTIWQNVTIGSHGKKHKQLSYPTIESNCRIFPGAIIIGGIIIG